MKSQSNHKEPKILNNKYIIKHELSSGSFGVVFLAIDKITKEQVAVKLEREENEDVGTLEREVEIFQKLGSIKGVPLLFWHGCEQNYNVIVMSLLGKDLAHYMKTHKKLSLKSVLQMSNQFVNIMERIHAQGVIHRDLKPENLMVGRGSDTSSLFLVDFGVSKIYLDNNLKHIPFKDKKSFIGTTRYASLAAHKGHELGRKDDLESLFYVLIYFLKGYIQVIINVLENYRGNKDRTELVGEYKQRISVSEICSDCPSEFQFIFNYLRTLEYRSQPNYNLIKLQIQKMAGNNDLILDTIYEWSEKPILMMKSQENINEEKPHQQQDVKIDSQINIDVRIKDQLLWSVSDIKSGLLKPPEPKLNAGSNNVVRSDSRNNSQCSIQGSFSSMQIKYVPSKFEQSNKNIVDKKVNTESVLIQSHQITSCALIQDLVKDEIPLINDKQISLDFQNDIEIPLEYNLSKRVTLDSTWGHNDQMDEYLGDSPKLGQKLNLLHRQSVNVYKFYPYIRNIIKLRDFNNQHVRSMVNIK